MIKAPYCVASGNDVSGVVMRFASKARTLHYGDRRLRTPLLVPAFSSRAPLNKVGTPLSQCEINTYLAQIGEDVVGPALISAFDLHHQNIPMPEPENFSFGAAPTFLDSGGYENYTLTDKSGEVTESRYFQVLRSWPESLPIIAVNFDCEDGDLGQQVHSALSLPVTSTSGKLLLLKPGRDKENERSTGSLAPIIAQIPKHAIALENLSAIGLTEKEAGQSFEQRIAQIKALRRMLDDCGLAEKPIHVFGGLDPIRTPYYFLAGADIFDGTSWLRFAFDKGQAVYLDAHASIQYPDKDIALAEWLIRRQNLGDIVQLQISMRSFLASGQLGELDLDESLLRRLFPEDV